jgi:hypothetical protein
MARGYKSVLTNGKEKIKKLPKDLFHGHFDSDGAGTMTVYEVSQPRRTTPDHLPL